MSNTVQTHASQEPQLLRLDSSSSAEEQNFLTFLNENMVGQPDAKKAALRIRRAILNPYRDQNRPIFSVILAGESRTGKNHIVRLLARWFHGNEKALVKINGGEFMEKHNLARLIGSPHGYIGFNGADERQKRGERDTGALLSQHNLDLSHEGSDYDVAFVLVDEWEKMHPDVINLLLAGLDEGEFTIANNSLVNFRNVVLVMTANMGMKEVENSMRRAGFHREADKKPTHSQVESAVKKAYRERTSPEFRNRIDTVVVYESLTDGQLKDIVGLEFKVLEARTLTAKPQLPFTLLPDDLAISLLLSLASGGDGSGIPNLKRAMSEHVIEPLGMLSESGAIRPHDIISISVEGGKIIFSKHAVGSSVEVVPEPKVPSVELPRTSKEEKVREKEPATRRKIAPPVRIVTVPDYLL